MPSRAGGRAPHPVTRGPGRAEGGAPASAQGRLKVFIGAAPGVGKTFAMLQEAHLLASKGRDVAIAWVQTYGRPLTEEAAGELERIPPQRVRYRGMEVDEMDLDAALERHPEVALVDELANTNVPGVRHAKRGEDVEELRRAGIEVWTTVNIQHIESLRDVVERVTGVAVRETVPDAVVDAADELTLADMTPEALRKRMRHGNVYPPERIEASLNSFFREGNLAALRELAIWYVVQHRSRSEGAAPEEPVGDRVLIITACGSAAPGLVRRGARMGRRLRAPVTVLAVHERPPVEEEVAPVRTLAADLGLEFDLRVTSQPSSLILQVADELGATDLVVAAESPARGRGLGRELVAALLRNLGERHLHVIGRRLGTGSRPADDGRPDPALLLAGLGSGAVRGGLRLYLGYAPGVGKTTRLLEEALRRQRRGAEVAVASPGALAPRPTVRYLLEQLNVVPSLATGAIDVEGLLRRNPKVVCVDDLGVRDLQSKRTRYQQIRRLLSAGISVVATVSVIDLPGFESARERLAPFRGDEAGARAPVPPWVLDSADEIELVDLPPTELRERIRSGWLTDAERLAEALQAFSEPLLEELRSAALRRVAAHTEARRQQYLPADSGHGLSPVEERIMVALRPGRLDQAAQLLRAGQRAARREDATLVVISVVAPSMSTAESGQLERLGELTARHGVRLVPVPRDGGLASTLLRWGRDHRVTAIFMPAPMPRRRLPWEKPVALDVIERAEEVDIHILGERALPKPAGLSAASRGRR